MQLSLQTAITLASIVFAAGVIYNKVGALEKSVVLLWKVVDEIRQDLRKGG